MTKLQLKLLREWVQAEIADAVFMHKYSYHDCDPPLFTADREFEKLAAHLVDDGEK